MTTFKSAKEALNRALSGTFGLDLRSLAVMRIMLGFMLMRLAPQWLALT